VRIIGSLSDYPSPAALSVSQSVSQSVASMLTADDYEEVLGAFPAVPFAFSYGSGCIEQAGYDYAPVAGADGAADLPMVDFIFAVDSTEAWHEENRKRNPSHYSPLFPLSTRQLADIQDHYGAGVWFNTMIPMGLRRNPSRQMKYGVISKKNLLNDLFNWSDVYAAGRLHKPVRILRADEDVTAGIKSNCENAVRVALLLLPSVFSEKELYMKIASLSYSGDPRMTIGENPRKVENLVSGTIRGYRAMYEGVLARLQPDIVRSEVASPKLGCHGYAPIVVYQQFPSPKSRYDLLDALPANVQAHLQWPARTTPHAFGRVALPSEDRIIRAMANIVKRLV
jgi:hypothetical protein